MFRISDVIQSCLETQVLKQDFKDKLLHYQRQQPDLWRLRVKNSAHSVLAAACFRESAIAARELGGCCVFSPIGLYYSLFHFSMGCLWLNFRIKGNSLRGISHDRLGGFVGSQMVQCGFLAKSYQALLEELRGLREQCNYKFGYHQELFSRAEDLECRLVNELDSALEFLHQVLATTKSQREFGIWMADGFGSDLMDTYLEPSRKENVQCFLAERGLSV
jgi:hypothetical protein